MLYEKNQTEHISGELFRNPSSEYRGTPFWAWNGRLDRDRLTEQIQVFKKMGLGGFHMHVRTGMDSPYLEEEFMDSIRHCIGKAREMDMLAWLYDEDRWPSGTAGGRVTAGRPEYARKSLLFTTNPYEECAFPEPAAPEPGRGQENIRQENGRLLAVYDILLDRDGKLEGACRVSKEEPVEEGAVRWYAYMEYASADPWFNNQAYVDTLNPEAIAEFIRITHEAYARNVGEHFGKLAPAIFTDEPQFTPRGCLDFADEAKDVFLPWTTGLPEAYRQAYGEELLDALPELFWERADGRLSTARWRFQNLVTNLFVESYCEQIGSWCREHGLYLTGHVMGEGSLYDQTQAVGDAMRCYPSFGLPGMDMLCDFREYTTAKQVQSMVRQTGAEGMLSELYGVTGWDYDFRGYKLQGDWQAALGVTVRVPHLAWYTMKGEAKRDYPASISYQSPWWEEFSMVEDHFARLNVALTRGKALVKVAVLHPIETYWLYFGPGDQTAALREQMDAQFAHLAEALLFGGIDFDYLCEARLPEQCVGSACPLQVGEMAYETVIVPPIRTIRSGTLKILTDFAEKGGKLIFLGDCPDYVDARPSDAAAALYGKGIRCGLLDSAILSLVEGQRFLHIQKADGRRAEGLLHQLRREESGDMWLFVCNGRNPASPDVDPAGNLRFTLNGDFKVTLYDTMTGDILPLAVRHDKGRTILERPWYIHESMLLLLEEEGQRAEQADSGKEKTGVLSGCHVEAAPSSHRGGTEKIRVGADEDSSCGGAKENPGDEAEAEGICGNAGGMAAWDGAKGNPDDEAEAEGICGNAGGMAAWDGAKGNPDDEAEAEGICGNAGGMAAWDGAKGNPDDEAEAEGVCSNAGGTAAWDGAEADILPGEVDIALQEPNMLLLDMAEYALDDGEYYSEDELLRIDNHARRELGIPLRRKEVVQPYLVEAGEPEHTLHLRFRIPSEIGAAGLKLGLECPETSEIRVNGIHVPPVGNGWYVDRDIRTVSLPDFAPGENLLEIAVPIGPRTNLENFYLLGDFGVRIGGTVKTLTEPVRKIGWGDIASQGLPFYTGNLTYRTKVRSWGDFTVRVPQYRGGLVKILVDGKDCGNIAFSPYTLRVRCVPGEHVVEWKLYGTRQNGFAQLHHTQGVYFYQSPNSWRSAGDLWSYEYRLKPAGILKSPEIAGAVFLDGAGNARRRSAAAMHFTDRS